MRPDLLPSRGLLCFHVPMQSVNPRPKQGQQSITLHSVTEVATEKLDCSEMHVYRLIAAGLLRAVDIATPGAGRSKTRIRSDDLADYIERQTRGRQAV
jgi:excisionase family DNA binding protein